MKLLNKSVFFLSVSILIILSLWATIFYFNMLREIKESVDEGMENYKRQIIQMAMRDSALLTKSNFSEGFFSITEIGQEKALAIKDRYVDTLMYMQDSDDEKPEPEPTRMLTTAFEKNGHYYELSIITSMVEEDDLITELLLETIWLYAILVVSMTVISNFVLQRLWKPFYLFLDQLRDYRLGSKKIPAAQTRTREFIDLQLAVKALLQHSTEAYEQQKEFIGNAAHELQTPLAIMISKLELLVEDANLKPNQAQNIAETMNIVERLVRLNKSLLLFTKIENKQFPDEQTLVLNSVVRQIVEEFEDIAAFRNVKISVSETARLSVQMDSSLADVLVSNLLRNALVHNVQGGVVDVFISAEELTFINTGRDTPLDEHKVFTRFYKSETDQNSTGLGLAIAKAISDLYGFSLSYRFANAKHRFEVHTRR